MKNERFDCEPARVRGCRLGIMRHDPEGEETAALTELLPNLEELRVLEVGCGDGRLTRRYAERTGSVLAIDPEASAIATFRDTIPPALRARVQIRTGTIVTLGEPSPTFDRVVFAWSL